MKKNANNAGTKHRLILFFFLSFSSIHTNFLSCNGENKTGSNSFNFMQVNNAVAHDFSLFSFLTFNFSTFFVVDSSLMIFLFFLFYL